MRKNEIKDELDEIKKWEERIKQKDLMYRANKYKYNFQQYETIRSFGEGTYADKITKDEDAEDQSILLKNIVEFNEKFRTKTKECKDKKRDTYKSACVLYEGQELTFHAFRSGIFQIKSTQGEGHPSELATRLKILNPKQMLQRLPIALGQVKAGNTSENLLNEIRQIIYYLYRAKQITKKVYNNIMNSVKV